MPLDGQRVEIKIPKAFKFLRTPKRYKAVYGGRGSGKSHSIARTLLCMGMEKPLRIVCAREIQKSIKDSVHQLLSDVIRSHPVLSVFYEIQESVIKGANGTEFKFRGLRHNTRDLKSLEGADICWIEEAENVSDNSYEILIPTIRKDNSEIWASFNVRNTSDPSYRRFVSEGGEDTSALKVSWRDNPYLPQVLKDEMDKLRIKDMEAYLHIWEGEPDIRRSGAIYAKQLVKARQQGRITKVPYDPSSEVFTAWDLGFGDATAIWFLQFKGRELRWIDFYENNGEKLLHYAELIKSKPYNYMKNGHFLPHDGGNESVNAESTSKQLRLMGVPNRVLEREVDIGPGIEQVRQMLEFSAIDNEKCKEGIRSLENYAYEWNEDRAVFSSNPKHDWTSHCADAARYACRAAKLVRSINTNRPDVSFSIMGASAPI